MSNYSPYKLTPTQQNGWPVAATQPPGLGIVARIGVRNVLGMGEEILSSGPKLWTVTKKKHRLVRDLRILGYH